MILKHDFSCLALLDVSYTYSSRSLFLYNTCMLFDAWFVKAAVVPLQPAAGNLSDLLLLSTGS